MNFFSECMKYVTFVAFGGSITNCFMASCTYIFGAKRGSATLGVIKNETLVFVNFSAQDASILKISVAFMKRRS